MIVRLVLALILVCSFHEPVFSLCIGGGNITLGYPEHNCREPSTPFCFSTRSCNEFDISMFKREVDRYSKCIDEYVENVDADIKCAREKRNEAVEEFNRFIRSVR
jgi:hypothetical protein